MKWILSCIVASLFSAAWFAVVAGSNSSSGGIAQTCHCGAGCKCEGDCFCGAKR